jgi:hypothetical protein
MRRFLQLITRVGAKHPRGHRADATSMPAPEQPTPFGDDTDAERSQPTASEPQRGAAKTPTDSRGTTAETPSNAEPQPRG